MKSVKKIVYGLVLCIGGLAHAEGFETERVAPHELSQELISKHQVEHNQLTKKQAEEREMLAQSHRKRISHEIDMKNEYTMNPQREQEYQNALKNSQATSPEINLAIGRPQERYAKRVIALNDTYRKMLKA